MYAASSDLGLFFNKDIIVQEKFDGSQISFYKDESGEMHVYSKSTELSHNEEEAIAKKQKQFVLAVTKILDVQNKIPQGLIFRGEYFEKLRHNVLAYGRIPNNNIIVFDVHKREVGYQLPKDVKQIVADIGFEYAEAQTLQISSEEDLNDLLKNDSQLGGPREGIVLKRYNSGKLHALKIVKQEFAEVARPGVRQFKTPLKERTPVKEVIEIYKTPARWEKAFQHLRDSGFLTGTAGDISKLVREVHKDVVDECKQEIMEYLFERQWKEISQGLTDGLADWYLMKLSQDKDNE